jgi:hypothetical protein
MFAFVRSVVCVIPKLTSKTFVEPEGAQACIDRRSEGHIDEHGGHLATWPLVVQDLDQLAHQAFPS